LGLILTINVEQKLENRIKELESRLLAYKRREKEEQNRAVDKNEAFFVDPSSAFSTHERHAPGIQASRPSVSPSPVRQRYNMYKEQHGESYTTQQISVSGLSSGYS
jgi:hypothetical protein